MSGRAWPLCGHQRAVSLLSGEIVDRRVRHAYLITGPAGVGKSTLTQAFAKALVCSNAAGDGMPCGECDACRRVDRGTHPDVQHFSLETQRQQGKDRATNERLNVETIRELTSVSAYRAYSSDFRVIIVDDAETMTEIAQEALLKTLEEPPPQLVLILLSDQVESLLPTIRSRCERVGLGAVPTDIIAGCLEHAGQIPERAIELAGLAQGLPGWAFRAIEDSDVLDERSHLQQRVRLWVAANPFQRVVRAFELAAEFSKSRDAVFSELEAAAHHWREVMMSAAGAYGDADTGQRPDGSLASSLRALVAVTECMSDLHKNVRPRLALEAMVMQWPVSSLEAE